MKPKVIHILDDQNVGGVYRTLLYLLRSRLNQTFDFQLIRFHDWKRSLKEVCPDLIVYHEACNWQRLMQVAHLKRFAPVILHEHHYSAGFERYNLSNPQRFRTMLQLSSHIVDQIVAVSEAHQEWMVNDCGLSADKISMIQQCHPLGYLLNQPMRPIQSPMTFGVYGRFSRQKGFDTLLKALQHLPEQCLKVRIGGYGADESWLKTLLPTHIPVEWVGRVQDVAGFLDQCDVVVIPSRWEPWGNVCLEARAAGKPIIAANVDGLREQVLDRGLLFEPDDDRQLAEQIQVVLEMPPYQLQEWGHLGRESVRGMDDRYLQQWETLLWKFVDVGAIAG